MNSLNLSKSLDNLSHAEQRSMLPRLQESTVFVSWASADEAEAVREMVAQEQEHIAWLVGMISDLGESPTPCTADVRTTSIHYLQLDAIMPRVTQNKKNLVARYEQAAAAVSSDEAASALVGRITERHQAHVARLETLSGNSHPTSSES